MPTNRHEWFSLRPQVYECKHCHCTKTSHWDIKKGCYIVVYQKGKLTSFRAFECIERPLKSDKPKKQSKEPHHYQLSLFDTI